MIRRLMSRRRTSRRLLVAGAACLALAVPLILGPASPARAEDQLDVQVTLYGWPDNSPPGDDIDCPQIHDHADGTGTYDDPITFATGNDQDDVMPCGTIVYVPFLKKYFIREDSCATCDGPWTDLWAGGEGSDDQAVLDCEDSLTRDGVTVTIDPGPDEEVDETPIFDSDTGECYQPSDNALRGNSIPKQAHIHHHA